MDEERTGTFTPAPQEGTNSIHLHEYTNTETREKWVGWIEPDSLKWIVFVSTDGIFYHYRRDPNTGAVTDSRPYRVWDPTCDTPHLSPPEGNMPQAKADWQFSDVEPAPEKVEPRLTDRGSGPPP